jgi:hypothetical protein
LGPELAVDDRQKPAFDPGGIGEEDDDEKKSERNPGYDQEFPQPTLSHHPSIFQSGPCGALGLNSPDHLFYNSRTRVSSAFPTGRMAESISHEERRLKKTSGQETTKLGP